MSEEQIPAVTPEGKALWREVATTINRFGRQVAFYRRLSGVLSWGTPVVALLATLLAVFGDKTKAATAIAGGIATAMGAMNAKIEPKSRAMNVLKRENAWRAFELEFKVGMRGVYNANRGRDVTDQEAQEGRYLKTQNEKVSELRMGDEDNVV